MESTTIKQDEKEKVEVYKVDNLIDQQILDFY